MFVFQAVFRKILGKGKKGGVKIKSNKDGDPSTSGAQSKSEELERKKQEWQSELGQMSEFLFIKSSNEQKEEGVEHPVDTAWIEDKDGLPTLKALFDVGLFKEENVDLKVEDDQLILTAKSTEEHEEREYTRTMVRKLDLPKHVDHRMMSTNLDEHGLLHVEMPFHLPPQRRPKGPNVFPIVTDAHGRRKLRIMIYIGSDFTSDDVSVSRKSMMTSRYGNAFRITGPLWGNPLVTGEFPSERASTTCFTFSLLLVWTRQYFEQLVTMLP